MSDWQVGDIAVCVDASSSRKLVEGAAYVVESIGVAEPWWRDAGELGLWLVGTPSDSSSGGFRADRFRKVTPDKPEACESEFVTLLNRIKRKQGADA